MTRRFYQCLSAGMSVVCLLIATSQPVSATIVFDDHFDGNSGGIPEGWHLLFGPGWAQEAGTIVTLCGDVAILSDAFLDPSQGTVAVTTDISGTDSEYGIDVGLVEPQTWNRFLCKLFPSGELSIRVADLDGGEQYYVAGTLNEYTGGAIRVTLVLEPTAFTVSTDSPPFSSGPISYTAVFPTFTREDLGSAVNAALGNDVVETGTGCSGVDRITVEAESPTPVENISFGQVKALFRR